MIMEPLRGGKLVFALPEEAKKIVKNNAPGYALILLRVSFVFKSGRI